MLWAIDFLDLLLVPFNALIYLKAILLTAWRLMISHRHLLEWQTASDADGKVLKDLTGIFGTMWIAPVSAVLIAALLVAARFPPIADTLNLGQYLPEPSKRIYDSWDHLYFVDRLVCITGNRLVA